MTEYILKLLYDYSINGKSVDNEFVERVVGHVVGYKQLGEYLTGVYYYNDGANQQGSKLRVADYNLIDKFLSINIDSMNKYIELYTNCYGSVFNELERNFFGNYLVTQILLHELEHVSQNRKYNLHEHDDESVLIDMVFYVSYALRNPFQLFEDLRYEGYTDAQIDALLKRQVELYKKYYKYNPTERLAQIKSFNAMSEVLDPISKDIPNIYMYNAHHFLENLIQGYEISGNEIESPTNIYINGMGYEQTLYRFNFYEEDPEAMKNNIFNNYSKVERLSYGFPVTMEEYDDTKKLLIKCDKFRTI